MHAARGSCVHLAQHAVQDLGDSSLPVMCHSMWQPGRGTVTACSTNRMHNQVHERFQRTPPQPANSSVVQEDAV